MTSFSPLAFAREPCAVKIHGGFQELLETALPAYAGAAFLCHLPGMTAPDYFREKRPLGAPLRFDRVDEAFPLYIEKQAPVFRSARDTGFSMPGLTIAQEKFFLVDSQKAGNSRSLAFPEEYSPLSIAAIATFGTFKYFHPRRPPDSAADFPGESVDR